MKKIILLVLSVFWTVAQVSAQQYTWIGANSSSWYDQNNWSPNGVPNSSSNVVLNVPAPTYFPMITGTVTIGELNATTGKILGNGMLIITGNNSQINNITITPEVKAEVSNHPAVTKLMIGYAVFENNVTFNVPYLCFYFSHFKGTTNSFIHKYHAVYNHRGLSNHSNTFGKDASAVTTITNIGNEDIYYDLLDANWNVNVVNGKLILDNQSTGNIHWAYLGVHGVHPHLLTGQVELRNASTGGITFRSGDGYANNYTDYWRSPIIFTDYPIISGNFSQGTLNFINALFLPTTPFVFDSKAIKLYYQNCKFNSNIDLIGDTFSIIRNTFLGSINNFTHKKDFRYNYRGISNFSNTFGKDANAVTTITNIGNEEIYYDFLDAGYDPNVVNGKLILDNQGTGTIHWAYEGSRNRHHELTGAVLLKNASTGTITFRGNGWSWQSNPITFTHYPIMDGNFSRGTLMFGHSIFLPTIPWALDSKSIQLYLGRCTVNGDMSLVGDTFTYIMTNFLGGKNHFTHRKDFRYIAHRGLSNYSNVFGKDNASVTTIQNIGNEEIYYDILDAGWLPNVVNGKLILDNQSTGGIHWAYSGYSHHTSFYQLADLELRNSTIGKIYLRTEEGTMPLHIKGNIYVNDQSATPNIVFNPSVLFYLNNPNINQTISRLSANTQPLVIPQLIMDKPNSILDLQSNVLISKKMTFASGFVTTSSDAYLGFLDNATYENVDATRFVAGRVYKAGDDAFVFPIGKLFGNTKLYRPLTISAPVSSSSHYVAEYFDTNAGNQYSFSQRASDIALLDGEPVINPCFYWSLLSSASSPVRVGVDWQNAVCPDFFASSSTKILAWDSNQWVSKGQSAPFSGSYLQSGELFSTSVAITLGETGAYVCQNSPITAYLAAYVRFIAPSVLLEPVTTGINNDASYKWYKLPDTNTVLATTQKFTATETGRYMIKVKRGCRVFTSETTVFDGCMALDYRIEYLNCQTVRVTATSDNPATIYEWLDSNGDVIATGAIQTFPAGSYYTLVGRIDNCALELPVSLFNSNLQVFAYPNEDCSKYKLVANTGFDSYLWSNGATTESIMVNADGVYTVTAKIGTCTQTATVQVDYSTGMISLSLNLPSLTLPNVLSASASTFSEQWLRTGSPLIYSASGFGNGQRGIWKPHETYAYVTDRQRATESNGEFAIPKVATDGVFTLSLFNWQHHGALVCPAWLKTQQVTQYNPFNFEIENKDILDRYTSALYGYKNQLPIATAGNARVDEIAFESFEEYPQSVIYADNVLSTDNNLDLVTYSTGNNTVPSYQLLLVELGVPKTTMTEHIAYVKGNVLTSSSGFPIDNVFVKGYRLDPNNPGMFIWRVRVLSSSPVGNMTKLVLVSVDGDAPTCYWNGELGISKNERLAVTMNAIATLEDKQKHTGKKSLKLDKNGNTVLFQMTPKRFHTIKDKKYVFSTWVKLANACSLQEFKVQTPSAPAKEELAIATKQSVEQLATPSCQSSYPARRADYVNKVYFTFSGNLSTSPPTPPIPFPAGNLVYSEVIEGWVRIEQEFVATGEEVEITAYHRNDTFDILFIDDIRIHPFNSSMQTYVYDTKNYKLRATLDGNNFSSLYFYDEQGNLYLTKKETERGIQTIQEALSHQPKK